MCKAAHTARWDHTARILCQQANLHRGKEGKVRTPAEFHPFTDIPSDQPRGMTADQLHAFRHAFKTIIVSPEIETE